MTSSRRSATPRASAEDEPLVVGVLAGPHGIRGELKLRPLTEFPERIPKLKELRLRFQDGREETRRVRSTRLHKEMVLVTLEGVTDRDSAEALRGASVLIDAADAHPLPEGRFYLHQLIGLRVVTPQGEELGTISDVHEFPANDVYVCGRYLIPATKDAVERISPEEGILVVRSREYLEGEEVR
jgi:16S rRNA processing protein RimM